MRIGSNVDHTILFLYLKEFPIHTTLVSWSKQKNHFLGCQLVIKFFFSQNLQLIPVGNFIIRSMLIIRKLL